MTCGGGEPLVDLIVRSISMCCGSCMEARALQHAIATPMPLIWRKHCGLAAGLDHQRCVSTGGSARQQERLGPTMILRIQVVPPVRRVTGHCVVCRHWQKIWRRFTANKTQHCQVQFAAPDLASSASAIAGPGLRARAAERESGVQTTWKFRIQMLYPPAWP